MMRHILVLTEFINLYKVNPTELVPITAPNTTSQFTSDGTNNYFLTSDGLLFKSLNSADPTQVGTAAVKQICMYNGQLHAINGENFVVRLKVDDSFEVVYNDRQYVFIAAAHDQLVVATNESIFFLGQCPDYYCGADLPGAQALTLTNLNFKFKGAQLDSVDFSGHIMVYYLKSGDTYVTGPDHGQFCSEGFDPAAKIRNVGSNIYVFDVIKESVLGVDKYTGLVLKNNVLSMCQDQNPMNEISAFGKVLDLNVETSTGTDFVQVLANDGIFLGVTVPSIVTPKNMLFYLRSGILFVVPPSLKGITDLTALKVSLTILLPFCAIFFILTMIIVNYKSQCTVKYPKTMQQWLDNMREEVDLNVGENAVAFVKEIQQANIGRKGILNSLNALVEDQDQQLQEEKTSPTSQKTDHENILEPATVNHEPKYNGALKGALKGFKAPKLTATVDLEGAADRLEAQSRLLGSRLDKE
ncbi:Hypothetical_protein [Hexamita inflata]|uniref:Hypothetical_protein n=1 Tax=Hexamita inflata TaxID=28002 RepID=A0AA86QUU7_9EUKA|nr:Hypothetical protein HINF_LOCUS48817 [Hexamita inflata]